MVTLKSRLKKGQSDIHEYRLHRPEHNRPPAAPTTTRHSRPPLDRERQLLRPAAHPPGAAAEAVAAAAPARRRAPAVPQESSTVAAASSSPSPLHVGLAAPWTSWPRLCKLERRLRCSTTEAGVVRGVAAAAVATAAAVVVFTFRKILPATVPERTTDCKL